MTGDAAPEEPIEITIVITIVESRAVDEMIGKIQMAAGFPTTGAAVQAWVAEHASARLPAGHDHAVIGATLMYLHDAVDGTLVPHALYPDGTERIYTDAQHAEEITRAPHG